MICAVAGTVLTLIGPNKISDLTDVLQNGLFGQIDMGAVADIINIINREPKNSVIADTRVLTL